MCQYIETICCQNGQLLNLDYHQQRLNQTFDEVLKTTPFSLEDKIQNLPERGKYKCRVLYDKTSVEAAFTPYQARNIQSLKLVEGDDICYRHKAADRSRLARLHQLRADCDDIIILKNGCCTDAYFANLAFFDGQNWYTPQSPLLNGTKRQQLIDEGILTGTDLKASSLNNFEKVSLINAMLDLEEVVVPVDQIY